MDNRDLKIFGAINAAAASNNLHHTQTYQSEEDWIEENLGKGKGDPDIYGYPGEVVIEDNKATVTLDRPF